MKFLLLLLIFVPSLLHAKNEIELVLNRLDNIIKDRKLYRIEKERRIDALKFSLSHTDEIMQKYTLFHNLFDEYKAYQYDSAYTYAINSYEFASLSGHENQIAQSMCDLIYCYSTIGFFKEAAEVVSDFDLTGVSSNVMINFYEVLYRYYNNLSRYVGPIGNLATDYEQKRVESIDNTLYLATPNSFKHRYIEAQKLVFVDNNYNIAIRKIGALLETKRLLIHNQAILYAWRGLCYEMTQNRDSAIYNTTLSTIADIESCTYETSSAKVLARYMFERGDITRANRYINLALDDANIYNSHIQKLEIQAIMPQISAQRYNNIVRDRRYLIAISCVIVLLLFLIIIMVVIISRRNRELHNIRRELEMRASELSTSNNSLSTLNNELDKANKIKDQYIIESLYGDSYFVDNVERMCKILVRKIKAKQFADILEVVGGMGIKRERLRMASSFDSAFLKLFPNFIEEYNKLFALSDRLTLGDGGELPTEVRIFALIKLGVEESSLISKYLNISLNTVYVYKAKVKARTIVPKDEFEECLKHII